MLLSRMSKEKTRPAVHQTVGTDEKDIRVSTLNLDFILRLYYSVYSLNVMTVIYLFFLIINKFSELSLYYVPTSVT